MLLLTNKTGNQNVEEKPNPHGFPWRTAAHSFSDAGKSRARFTRSRLLRMRKLVFFPSAIVTHGGFGTSFIPGYTGYQMEILKHPIQDINKPEWIVIPESAHRFIKWLPQTTHEPQASEWLGGPITSLWILERQLIVVCFLLPRRLQILPQQIHLICIRNR